MGDPAELVVLRATRDQIDAAVRWVEQADGRAGLDLRSATDLGAQVARAMIERIDHPPVDHAEDLHLVCTRGADQIAVTVGGGPRPARPRRRVVAALQAACANLYVYA